jgi:YVTN family beta-propeller protein
MTKSNLTLTQSGLLAVLLQRQRHKVCMRCASRERFNKESKPNMKTLIMTILFAFVLASSALAQSAQMSPARRPSLFVPARYSDEVAVINTSTNQVVTQIPVGRFPIRIAITPDRRKAFISDALSASISVLDTVARTNIATIPVSTVPGESAVTPDGGRLFVVHEGGVNGNCPVDVIDTATNLVITTVLLPGYQCKDILFTLDGRFAYISNNSAEEVDVIDATTYQVTSIPTGGAARRLCISPAGDRVYVTNNGTNGTVSAIDTATKQLIATITVGHRPIGIAITPNGQEVYATNQQDGTVSVIDTTTLTVIATVPTGNLCQRVVITRDGAKAFVQNGYSDTVSAIDTATHTVIATLPVGHHPWTILASPDDIKLYVCNATDTTVTVIDIPSLTVSDTIANVGSAPFDLAFGP